MLLIMFVVYGFFPYAYSTKKYFERMGFESVVIEYEFLKKMLYVVIPFGVAIMI